MHARTQSKEMILNVRSLTKLQLWHPKTWVLSHSLATWPWTSRFSSPCLFPHKCREIHHNEHVQPSSSHHVVLVFRHSVVSDSLRPHGLQHTRLLCPPLSSPSLLKFMSTESVMLSNHLILCCHLLLLPSIFPSIRVFSNESAFCI